MSNTQSSNVLDVKLMSNIELTSLETMGVMLTGCTDRSNSFDFSLCELEMTGVVR